MALGKMLFGCGLPLHITDSVHFKKFCATMRPVYKVPCRQTVSSTLLNRVHASFASNDKRNVGAESVLLIDGWKNKSKNTKNVATILQTADGTLSFLNSHDITGVSETGSVLASICEESIPLAKERFNTDVFCVVSDNAANMMSMGHQTKLFHSTCSSHTANLLAKDIINATIASRVTTILKEFKKSDLEKLIVDDGGVRCRLPVDTRWCTYRDAFKCLVENLNAMKKVAANNTNKLKQEVVHDIFDADFIAEVNEFITLF